MSATTAPPPMQAMPTPEAVMAQAGRENFPVAGLLLGRRRSADLLAIYGFARLVDDVGDEVTGDRSALLDWLEGDLDRIYAGAAPEHPILQALAPTIRARALPAAPFRRLIEANRRDQVVDRQPTFAALLDYCQLSAAPVGELVLHVCGAATPERIRLSDSVCAGLQLCEHLQDVAEDHARGRVYVPAEDLEHFGCAVEDLGAPAPSPQFVALMAFEVARTRALLAEGAPLIRKLPPRPALAVAGFVAGGRAALDALVRCGYDVLGGSPRPSRASFATALARTVARRR